MGRRDNLDDWIEDQAAMVIDFAADNARETVVEDPTAAIPCLVAYVAEDIIGDILLDLPKKDKLPAALGLLKALKKTLPWEATWYLDRALESLKQRRRLTGQNRPMAQARLPVDPGALAQLIMQKVQEIPRYSRIDIFESCVGQGLADTYEGVDWVWEYGRDPSAPITDDQFADSVFRDRLNDRIMRRAHEIAKERYG